MRYGVIQFPILGEASVLAAVASECAAEQGEFWEYHDRLYERSATEGAIRYTLQGLSDLAEDLGLEREQFSSCMFEGRPLDHLKADWEIAVSLGIGSTPTVFIDDVQYQGLRSFELMSARIEELLADR